MFSDRFSCEASKKAPLQSGMLPAWSGSQGVCHSRAQTHFILQQLLHMWVMCCGRVPPGPRTHPFRNSAVKELVEREAVSAQPPVSERPAATSRTRHGPALLLARPSGRVSLAGNSAAVVSGEGPLSFRPSAPHLHTLALSPRWDAMGACLLPRDW